MLGIEQLFGSKRSRSPPLTACLLDWDGKLIATLPPTKPYVIGRGYDMPVDVKVGEGNDLISRQHGVLEFKDGLWIFTDKSLNGTVLYNHPNYNNLDKRAVQAMFYAHTTSKIVQIKQNWIDLYNVGGSRTDFEKRIQGSSVPLPADTITGIYLNAKLTATEPSAYGTIVDIVDQGSVKLRLEIPKP